MVVAALVVVFLVCAPAVVFFVVPGAAPLPLPLPLPLLPPPPLLHPAALDFFAVLAGPAALVRTVVAVEVVVVV